MDLGPAPGDRRDVAVGPNRELAARVFGGRFDDPLVTTYDAFDTEVDLATVATLGVAAGPGLEPLLDRLEAEAPALWPERVLLGLPADRSGRAALEAALAARPSVAVAGVEESGRGLVLTLDLAANVSPETRERALATLRTPAQGSADASPARDRGARWAGLAARRRLLGRVGALALVLAILVGAVLVAIGQSSLGADGVLVTLATMVLLLQVVTVVGVVYALRLAREGRAEQQEQRRLLLARTDRLVELARTSARKDKETLREIERLQREIVALGRLQARARVEARERT